MGYLTVVKTEERIQWDSDKEPVITWKLFESLLDAEEFVESEKQRVQRENHNRSVSWARIIETQIHGKESFMKLPMKDIETMAISDFIRITKYDNDFL